MPSKIISFSSFMPRFLQEISNPFSLMSRSKRLSYDVNAPIKAIYRIRSQTDDERSQFIINTFSNVFHDGIHQNPDAFRGRFRKMSATPFNFYRGSAILFYQDLKIDQDRFIAKNNTAGQIFIHVSTLLM